jgi:hypothetical protein
LGAKFLKELEARQTANLKLMEVRHLTDQKLLEKQLEERQFTNQKLMQKRMEVFDEAAPLLNDLSCFIRRVGGWKEISPPDAIKAKRRLDRLMYINEALFSNEFRRAYFSFIHRCFETYVGPAKDAKLRTSLAERTLVPTWDKSWAQAFTGEEEDPEILEGRYHDVMACFALALGANR